jgi:pyroglutamyl-peptidase
MNACVSAADLRAPPIKEAVVLTGFGPFPGVSDNLSGTFLLALADACYATFSAFDFHHFILPTRWETAPVFSRDVMAERNPRLILHFGVARDVDGFRIEYEAHNHCRQAVDEAGLLPDASTVELDGPDCRYSTFPVEAIEQALERLGLPVQTSRDAGSYLCNAVLYQSLLNAARVEQPAMIGFVHIPATIEASRLSLDDLVRGAVAIVGTCLDHRH